MHGHGGRALYTPREREGRMDTHSGRGSGGGGLELTEKEDAAC